MNHYTNQDKVWLVKSSGKILGPYSADEIKFLLERRRVSIIDEVRDPKIRWGFVRENPLFADIVASLRDEEAQKMDNTTEVDALKTRTITTSVTDELTPTPSPISQFDADVRTPEVLPKREEVRSEPASKKTSPIPPSIAARLPRKPTYIGPMIGVMVVIVGLMAGYLYFGKSSSQKPLSAQDHIRLAKGYKEIGQFEKALNFYQKASQLAPLDPRSSIELAKLYLEVKGQKQVVESQRILEGVIPNLGPDEPLKDDARLLLGLSYSREGSNDRAAQVFDSLYKSSQQLNARLNVAIVKFNRGDYGGALRDLNMYTTLKGVDGVAIIAKALTEVRIVDYENKVMKKSPAIEDLDRYIRFSTEYRLEALLVRAFIYQKMNEKEYAKKLAKELLEEDPLLTKEHIHDLFVDRSLVSWENLKETCDQLTRKWSDTSLGKGMQAFCMMQLEEYGKARQTLEEGLRMEPKNPILNSQLAFLLNRQKSYKESQDIAVKYETASVLSARVAAMNCEELANQECAYQKWQIIRDKYNMPLDLGYLRGSANFQIYKDHRVEALKTVKEGLANSPNYRPLIELKVNLDAP